MDGIKHATTQPCTTDLKGKDSRVGDLRGSALALELCANACYRCAFQDVRAK